MSDLFSTTEAQLVLLLMVLAALVAVGLYLISKVRQDALAERQSASELLTDFRDMHAEGKLSDAEFRTIKSLLGPQLRARSAPASTDLPVQAESAE